MLRQIAVDRSVGDGTRNGEVLDAAEHLGNADYGSATNALVVMARQSPLFEKATSELRAIRDRESLAARETPPLAVGGGPTL